MRPVRVVTAAPVLESPPVVALVAPPTLPVVASVLELVATLVDAPPATVLAAAPLVAAVVVTLPELLAPPPPVGAASEPLLEHPSARLKIAPVPKAPKLRKDIQGGHYRVDGWRVQTLWYSFFVDPI